VRVAVWWWKAGESLLRKKKSNVTELENKKGKVII
jgi:ABC-type nitrate/sulfonate/bicarbonate transport system substrate-binding protein